MAQMPLAEEGRAFFEAKCGLRNTKNIIVAQCNSKPGLPSPVLSETRSPSFIPGTSNFPVFLPTEVVELRIPNVIDLRFPDVQMWMYEALLSGMPDTIYLYDDEPSLSAIFPNHISDELIVEFVNASGKVMSAVVNPPNEDWDGKKRHYASNLLELLSILMYSATLGGTPLTNAIGKWLLQTIGTSALIYPSARSDVMCSVQGKEISDFAGFILV
jgi:hypothetical protein